MTETAYRRRQDRIARGCCPRCGKRVRPWPLQRADVCWGRMDATTCPRHWMDIYQAEARIVVRRAREQARRRLGAEVVSGAR